MKLTILLMMSMLSLSVYARSCPPQTKPEYGIPKCPCAMLKILNTWPRPCIQFSQFEETIFNADNIEISQKYSILDQLSNMQTSNVDNNKDSIVNVNLYKLFEMAGISPVVSNGLVKDILKEVSASAGADRNTERNENGTSVDRTVIHGEVRAGNGNVSGEGHIDYDRGSDGTTRERVGGSVTIRFP